MFQDDCDHIHFLPLAFTGMASDDTEECDDGGNSLKKKLSRRHNHSNGSKNALTGRRDLEDILRIKGFSSESESEPEASFKLKKKMLHHHHRNVTTTPKRLNGFVVPNGATGDDSGSASDSAKDQVTWNSHNCGRSSEAEDDGSNSQQAPAEYYPIWQKPPSQTKIEQESIYETLYPSEQKKISSSDPPPPPLPPRASKPSIPAQKRPASLVTHRPLERTKALQYANGSSVQQETRIPPEVPRHQKPIPSSAALPQKQVTKNSQSPTHEENLPELPPRPHRLVNPEDAFAFEIIDVDEMRNSNGLNNSSHPRACKQFAIDPNNCDNVQQMNSNKKVLTDTSSAGSDSGGVSRPVRLAVEDTNNLRCCPPDVAPLATPEQDSSLIDCSSIENLVEDESSVSQDIIVDTCVVTGHSNLMYGIETTSEVLNQSTCSRQLSGGDNAQETMSVSSQQQDQSSVNKTEVEVAMATGEEGLERRETEANFCGCLLAVPTAESAGVSPISPCSIITPTSDSGLGNNTATNSSGSDSNTVVFSNKSSSSDSIASNNPDLPGEITATAAAENEEQGAAALPLVKSDIPRPHRPLSRQTTHPPPPAVFLLDSNVMADEMLLLSPRPPLVRPHNRLLSRVASPGTSLQCPPTPTHHARHNSGAGRSPVPLQVDRDMEDPPDCDDLVLDDPPPPATFRHLTTTRLPSIPERTYKSQRVELSADDEPLPPCEFVTNRKKFKAYKPLRLQTISFPKKLKNSDHSVPCNIKLP